MIIGILAALISLLAGVLSGLLGIGGGLVLVPLFHYLLKMDMHLAVGTSLAIRMGPVTSAGRPAVASVNQNSLERGGPIQAVGRR